MKISSHNFRQYLRTHPFDAGEREINNVLDYLVDCYLEDHPVSSQKIKEIREEMGPYYENIPFEASETLFQLVYTLCGAYDDAAFRAGLLVGLHLQNELGTQDSPTA